MDDARLPVFVRGARLPFLDSAGAYSRFRSYELGAKAIAGLLTKTGLAPNEVSVVSLGTVLHEVETSNVAREAMLAAGIPSTTPAFTVSMAGASPNVAFGAVCDMIALGRVDVAIAGGTETFSDLPIRLGRGIRTSAAKLYLRRTPAERFAGLRRLRPKDLLLEAPSGRDFTTRMTMGACCERMASGHGVTREESDAFAARSHRLAVAAWAEGLYDDEIVPVPIGARTTIDRDDTPRADATVEKLAKLSPSFDAHGVNTPGNSSRFTDGAGAALFTSLAAARRLGLAPRAIVRDHVLAGVASLQDEMLVGPAMAIPRLLARNGLRIEDVAVFELHEAFAAQILVNQRCLASDEFARTRLGLGEAPGAIPIEKLNARGGSLALGNPFAATGVRLVTTAVDRLLAGGGRYAIVATCAGGGVGAAMLLENADVL